MMSLRAMLLGSILASTCLAWGLAACLSYVDMSHEINQMFDAHLAESARSLLQQARHEQRGRHRERADDDDDDDDEENHGHLPALQNRGRLFERRLSFQLWDDASKLLIKSRRDVPDAPWVPLSHEGFAKATWKGEEIRVFSIWNRRRTVHVQVAESMQARLDLVQASMRNVLTPILIMIIPLLIVIVIAVESSLKILRRLSAELSRRTPQDLAPLHESGAPSEIRPIIAALNALFGRLNRALENERRFTADAAHELRTPLAAIKVQAQVALRSNQQEDVRNRALDGVVKGIDRATHLVEQLLTMARLDPETELKAESVKLRSLVVDVTSWLAPEALVKELDLTVKEGPELMVEGNRSMLEILVRNLVDNAIRYTPPRGFVHIQLEKIDSTIQLMVGDSGPGLTPEQKSHVLARFSRVSRPSGDGSGLGLSIVERIAAIHKAKLSLDTGPGGKGLLVKVIFQENGLKAP